MTIEQVEEKIGTKFSKMYREFLQSITLNDIYEIKNTGIYLYSAKNLCERNETYEVEKYEPNYFLIGQDGDLGFFIKKNNHENIFSNGLGSIGSLEMKNISNDINEFIEINKHNDNIKNIEKVFEIYLLTKKIDTKIMLYLKNKLKIGLNEIKETIKQQKVLIKTGNENAIKSVEAEINELGGEIEIIEKA